jgi:hypothetical protein
MRSIASRLRRLENITTPERRSRVLVRYEGPGSENLPEPNEEDYYDATTVITVRFVAAKDGRPVESSV